jgi:hypothetical protein
VAYLRHTSCIGALSMPAGYQRCLLYAALLACALAGRVAAQIKPVEVESGFGQHQINIIGITNNSDGQIANLRLKEHAKEWPQRSVILREIFLTLAPDRSP